MCVKPAIVAPTWEIDVQIHCTLVQNKVDEQTCWSATTTIMVDSWELLQVQRISRTISMLGICGHVDSIEYIEYESLASYLQNSSWLAALDPGRAKQVDYQYDCGVQRHAFFNPSRKKETHDLRSSYIMGLENDNAAKHLYI
jgi:hypothetical protein